MIRLNPLCSDLERYGLQSWSRQLPGQLEARLSKTRHGDLKKWRGVLDELPVITPSSMDFNADVVRVGAEYDCSDELRHTLDRSLRKLHPWRKGPYRVHGIFIDTEWRSDMKWKRLKNHIRPLSNKLVLDVGCGNGYHVWRIFGAGARMVIGIDPTLLSVAQFYAVRHFASVESVHVLPLGIQDLPRSLKSFDTVFSMGVLYHRRSPIDHLFELRDCLREGGELVLETLIVDGDEGYALLPKGRYAKMPNVWFLPSCATLVTWMERAGFKNSRVIDVTKTTAIEQRTTDWMRFQSLADFLDQDNADHTVDGLPAPKRAIFLADSP